VAVSSLLNPSSIVRERPTTAKAAQNFITGGSPLGRGIVASAANKIVGFQRGAGAVSARPPDLNSIIQTLSSNILNNVENRVQSINQNVTQIVNKKVGELEKDYGERRNKIDAAKPNAILQNFLNLYKEAIGYIQFLGDKKNVKALGENLKAVQKVFTETFNVAKIIRQVILQIVKQLSNLPTASTGGGGLNLDIAVPGGPLKRGPMSKLSRVLRAGRTGLMLGGAALAGGLGSKVVSGMLDVGGDVQAAQESEGTIPGELLDRFGSILDRFSSAISSLSRIKKSQPSTGGGGGIAIPQPPPPPGEAGGGKTPPAAPASPTAGAAGPQGPATKSLLDAISFAEGTFHQPNKGYNTHFGFSQTQDLSKHPDKVIRSGGYASAAFGRYQFMPGTWASVGGGSMEPEKQDAGAVKLVIRRLNRAGIKVNNESELESLLQKEGVSQKIASALAPEWASFPTVAGKSYYNQPNKSLSGIQKFYSDRLKSQGVSGLTQTPPKPQQTTPTVAAAQTQATTQQQIAQTVSQPPVQQAPQVNIAPMNIAGPQAQPTKSGDSVAPPPVMSKGGVTVPFLSPSNHDNFLTLYSKMVYNIVDG
jgi:lysozyme